MITIASATLLQGDCLEVLATLPAESVHCCVTSPPYWGLRDYGVEGQLGVEPTVGEYVEKLVAIFREVKRVLRSDGVVFLNLGDCYAGSWGNQGRKEERGTQRPINGGMLTPVLDGRYPSKGSNTGAIRDPGLKPKDLVGVPWRVAFALQDDGWWLRSDIIWAKPNPMPESVRDRPTKAHEYLFLLAKSPTYYFDAEAVKERAEYGVRTNPHAEPKAGRRNPNSGMWRNAGTATDPVQRGHNQRGATYDPEAGRNIRSVWTIATAPFAEAHFATFPPELAERCIKAGTSERGCCAACGAPWVRVVERSVTGEGKVCPSDAAGWAARRDGLGRDLSDDPVGTSGLHGQYLGVVRNTLGWQPSCTCAATTVPATVLDPFAGAATTLLVADRLQRRGIGIELNPAYVAMAVERLRGDAPLFASVAA